MALTAVWSADSTMKAPPLVSINSLTVDRASLRDMFNFAAAAGFTGIELCAHHFVPSQLAAADLDGMHARYGTRIDMRPTPSDAVSLADRFGVKIDGVVPGFDLMHNWIDELSAQRIQALQAMLPSFVEVGARYIILPVLDDSGARSKIAPSLRRMCEILEPFGLIAGLEPIGHVPRLSRLEDALEVLSQVPSHHRARLVMDAFHFFRGGNSLDIIEAIEPSQIVTVQISDAEDRPLEQLFGYKHRLHPGDGIFDVAGYCAALLARGYDGPFVAEIMNETYWRQDPGTVCSDAYAACRAVLGLQSGNYNVVSSTETKL